MDVPMSPMGSSWAREVESVAVLAPAREDAEGHIRKAALLEGELVETHRDRDRDVAGERIQCLSNSSAECARWLMAYETEHQEQFKEFPFSGLGALSYAFLSSSYRR
jgi:hypothetical protein